MDVLFRIPENWSDIASIAQSIECVLIFIGLIYAASQLKEASQSRRLQSLREILNEIGTPEIREARRWILRNIPLKHNKKTNKKKLTENDRKKLYDLAVAYDRVGLMLKLGFLPEEEFFRFQGDDIGDLWGRLQTIIYETRIYRPQHCKYFEYMATTWINQMKNKTGS